MSLEQWFKKGMDPDEYIESMEQHKENLLHVYDNFLLPQDEAFFNKLRDKKLRGIVITEDWCGDAMMNVPILFRIAQETNMDIKLLPRDQNLELMDQYLTNGTARSIPIFIFINNDGEEVAKWGPRAKEIQDFIDNSRAGLPDKEAADFEEKQKELFTFITKAYRENTDFWDEVYQSLKQALS
ncbi:thioredoxin family protein [Aquibacillus kalidii]|uniref:thioredoxin family protein n=1 Tax=Aquibacillus kalidii TaxID=2762597 RepID=UPI0016481979|nr:thioredoxin family protein [Aquibacillus kalidii]